MHQVSAVRYLVIGPDSPEAKHSEWRPVAPLNGAHDTEVNIEMGGIVAQMDVSVGVSLSVTSV